MAATQTNKKRAHAIQVAVSPELMLAVEAMRLERRTKNGGSTTLRSLMLEGLALLFKAEDRPMPSVGKSKSTASAASATELRMAPESMDHADSRLRAES
jgi:hypothetical protein